MNKKIIFKSAEFFQQESGAQSDKQFLKRIFNKSKKEDELFDLVNYSSWDPTNNNGQSIFSKIDV